MENDPHGRYLGNHAIRSSERTADDVLRAIRSVYRRSSLAGREKLTQVSLQRLPFLRGIAESEEEQRLEAADRVRRGQKLVTNLGGIDDDLVAIHASLFLNFSG